MKVTLKIPIEEIKGPNISMWSCLEVEFDDADSVDHVKKVYAEFQLGLRDNDGINEKEWPKIRNKHYSTGEIDVEDFEKLNKWQRLVINQDKLSYRANKKK